MSAAQLGDQGVGLLDGAHLHGTGQGQDPGAADDEDHLVVEAGAQVGMPLRDGHPLVHDGFLAGSHGRGDPLVIRLAHLAPDHPADGLGCRAQDRFADGFLEGVRGAAAVPAAGPARRLTLPRLRSGQHVRLRSGLVSGRLSRRGPALVARLLAGWRTGLVALLARLRSGLVRGLRVRWARGRLRRPAWSPRLLVVRRVREPGLLVVRRVGEPGLLVVRRVREPGLLVLRRVREPGLGGWPRWGWRGVAGLRRWPVPWLRVWLGWVSRHRRARLPLEAPIRLGHGGPFFDRVHLVGAAALRAHRPCLAISHALLCAAGGTRGRVSRYLATWRYSAIAAATAASSSGRARARAAAASRSRAARAGSPSTACTASARRCASPGGTRIAASSPSSPGFPPTRVATTGIPARSASCRMSDCPSHTLGSTNTSAALSRAGTSGRWPANRTVSPSDAARAWSSAASGPWPAMTSNGAGRMSPHRAAASSSRPNPCCAANRPTASTMAWPGSAPNSARSSARVSAEASPVNETGTAGTTA